MASSTTITASSKNNSTSDTKSLTIAAGEGLCVKVLMRLDSAGSGEIVSSVVFNGSENLTKLVSAEQGRARVEIWGIADPTATTANCVVTLNEQVGDWDVVYTQFDGGAAAPFGATGTDTGSGTAASINIASETNALVLDGLASGGADGGLTVGAGQTQNHNQGIGTSGTVNCGASEEAGAASVTMSWSWTNSVNFAAAAVEIEPDAGGPGQPSIDSTDAIDDHEIRLNVTAGSSADDHELYGDTTTPVSIEPANLLKGSLGATPTEVTATGLTGNDTWYFVLRASNASGDTDSPEFSDRTAPERPSGVTLSNATATSIDHEPTGGDIATFDVEVAHRKSGGQWVSLGLHASNTPWPITDRGLEPGTPYDYRARTVGPHGTSGWSTSSQLSTLSGSNQVTTALEALIQKQDQIATAAFTALLEKQGAIQTSAFDAVLVAPDLLSAFAALDAILVATPATVSVGTSGGSPLTPTSLN